MNVGDELEDADQMRARLSDKVLMRLFVAISVPHELKLHVGEFLLLVT